MRTTTLIAALCFAAAAYGQERGPMKIRVVIDGKVVSATLLDNPTAKDLVSLLPLAVTLEDYAAAEKITYLPRKLSTALAPAGYAPAPGDIAYYAPWGNVAIFYKGAPHAAGLVKLGRIDGGLDVLAKSGSLKATFETHPEQCR